MLVEIWLMFVIVSLALFVLGIFYAKFLQKTIILLLSMIFFIPASFYSFNVETVGFGDTATLTNTYAYHTIGIFLSFMLLLNIGLLIFYTLYEGIKESGVMQ
jgi:hypothetical protein